MSEVLVTGICHTLASYVSMQTFPTFTESGGHLSVRAPAGTAAARQAAAHPRTGDIRSRFMVFHLREISAAERAALRRRRPSRALAREDDLRRLSPRVH